MDPPPQVQNIFVASYNPSAEGSNFGDIALVQLDSPASEDTVDMAEASSRFPTSGWLTVAGWGLTEDLTLATTLQYASVPPLTTAKADQFRAEYGNSVGKDFGSTEEDHLAAGLSGNFADTCKGDSGGPLVVPGKGGASPLLVGATSYGLDSGCGGKSVNIGFYTSVGYWRDWIEDTMTFNNLRG